MISEDSSIDKSYSSIDKFANLPTNFEKYLSNAEGNGLGCEEIGLEKDQINTLPNLVRLSSSSIPSEKNEMWNDFRKYLVNEGQRKHSVRNKVGYARRYYYILETKDAQDLLKLSHGSKVHTMKALASLSKFLGKYDEWLQILKKYQLKWSKPDKSVNVFKLIFDSQNHSKDLESMLNWIRKVLVVLPLEYKNVLLFNTLTGLRPDEESESNLVNQDKRK